MLYPEHASLVHVDFKVQFLCLGPFLSNFKGYADETWPILSPR